MVPPPFLHNTGQKGEFVLPLNIPAGPGQTTSEKYDDFTFDAAAWTLTAHEARPGHELQFDSMLEHGVSLARVRYAFNSTNVEGWGLYSEYLIRPYMPLEGQLVSLDYRLMRAARAFLDPELQAGKIQPAERYRVLEQDVVQSHAFAQEEVERYTYRAPGQANSYFYGYTKLIALRKEVEAALGAKVQPEEVSRLHSGAGLVAAGSDAQGGDGRFRGQAVAVILRSGARRVAQGSRRRTCAFWCGNTRTFLPERTFHPELPEAGEECVGPSLAFIPLCGTKGCAQDDSSPGANGERVSDILFRVCQLLSSVFPIFLKAATRRKWTPLSRP